MYYNQNDYATTPYPAPGYPSATVESGGCGPTSAAMLIEDLVGIPFPPPEMAEYAIKIGARVSGGTDMAKLCRALCKDYGLKLTTTNQAADVLIALERGARIIANVGGDRTGHTGLFSTGGHYIYLRAKNGTLVTVWDAGYYLGKYGLGNRQDRVTVKFPDIYAEMVEIDKDCANRSPRYYILEDAMTKDEIKAIVAEVLAEINPIYADLADVPDYWQPQVKAMLETGAINGGTPDNPTDVNIHRETLKAAIIATMYHDAKEIGGLPLE